LADNFSAPKGVAGREAPAVARPSGQLQLLPGIRWPASQEAAVAEQERLCDLVDTTGAGPDLTHGGTIAGVDVAYDDARDRVVAAAVVLDAASHAVIDQATATGRIAFPYVSGLLAFRELPAVLDALAGLLHPPRSYRLRWLWLRPSAAVRAGEPSRCAHRNSYLWCCQITFSL
jgi:hypothetical protein